MGELHPGMISSVFICVHLWCGFTRFEVALEEIEVHGETDTEVVRGLRTRHMSSSQMPQNPSDHSLPLWRPPLEPLWHPLTAGGTFRARCWCRHGLFVTRSMTPSGARPDGDDSLRAAWASMIKLVHAADLHLDSPLRGLQRYEGAPVERIRGATRRALENLVELCLAEEASLLLIAGDLYDGNWKDYSTGLFFAKQMSRLRQAGIRVVLIRGNHDAASQITRSLHLPENVIELSTRKPETRVFEDLGVAIHGQGFPTRAVTDDLALRYPAAVGGLVNIGLLHTCATGRDGHDPYAPCTIETLISKGYDYWALGHVHAREILARDPWIVFPGNLQGRHARETGAKGATLVMIKDGRVAGVEHHPLDVVRWVVCEVDTSAAASFDDVLGIARERLESEAAAAEGRTLALRLDLAGATAAHEDLEAERERCEQALRALANDVPGEGLWIERIRFRTAPARATGDLEQRDDAIGHVVRSLRELVANPGAAGDLLEEFADLRRKLPHDVGEGEDGVRLDDPATIREALRDVERMLLPRLLSGDRRP
jgi:exonuclease SbcD